MIAGWRAAMLAALALAASAPQPAAVRQDTGVDARRAALLAREIARPFPDLGCPPDPAKGERCILGLLNHALAALTLGRDVDVANAELLDAVGRIPRVPGYADRGLPPDMPELDRFGADNLHFELAQFLFRIVRSFGARGSVAAGRLAPATETRIVGLFADWAPSECRVAEADPARVWLVRGSENHAAQHDAACWAAADLLAGREPPGFAYPDGSTAVAQRSAWTRYLEHWLAARGTHGLFVEAFSPTYAAYTLQNLSLYADFARDPELVRMARAVLDLWWAVWAQESVGGVQGGAKSRAYARTIAAGTPMETAAWLYFGVGRAPTSLPPGEAGAVAGSYRPPAIVAAIARDAGRGAYDAQTRVAGLAARPREGGWYSIDPVPAILRVTSVGPGYAMGLAEVARLPAVRWAEISAQNRWAGLVMANDPAARIVPTPAPLRQQATNALWGVQAAGAQIVQRLAPPFGSGGAMRLWVGAPLARSQAGGWLFVEGAAYGAARPARGGWHPDPAEPRLLMLDDPESPLIIQAGSRRDYPDLARFKAAVLGARLEVSPASVSWRALRGPRLTLFTDGRLPTIDGVAIDPEAGPIIAGPFVNQTAGSSRARITYGPAVVDIDLSPHP